MGFVPSHSLLLTLLLLLLNPHCAHPEYITSSEVNLVAQGTHEFIMHTVPGTNMTFLHSVTVEWKTLGACMSLGLTADVVSGEYHVTHTFETDTKMVLGLQWAVGEEDAIIVTVSDLSCDAAVFIALNVYHRETAFDEVRSAYPKGMNTYAQYMPEEAPMVKSVQLSGLTCPSSQTYTATFSMDNPEYASPPFTVTGGEGGLGAALSFNVGRWFVSDPEKGILANQNTITFTVLEGDCQFRTDFELDLVCVSVSVPETPTPKDTAVPYTYAPWVIRPQGEPRLKVWVYVAVGVGAVVVGFAALICFQCAKCRFTDAWPTPNACGPGEEDALRGDTMKTVYSQSGGTLPV